MSNLDSILREMEADASSAPRTIRLTVGQLVIAWAIIAGLMVMVFLFGFFSGRDQGLKIAFDQHADQAVRLPVVNSAALAGAAPTTNADALTASVTSTRPALPAPTEKGEFDFSASSVSPVETLPTLVNKPASQADARAAQQDINAEHETTGGFASKGALEAIGTAEQESAVAKLSDKETPQLTPENDMRKEPLDEVRQPKTLGQAEKTGEPTAQAIEPTEKVQQPAKTFEKTPEKAKEAKPAKETPKKAPQIPKPVVVTKTESRAGEAAMRTSTTGVTLPVAADVSSGWYVQVAATTKKADSDQLVSELRRSGVGVRVQQAQVGSAIYFRLLSGPYGSRDEAQNVQRRIRALKLGSGEPFLKKVN